MTFSWSIFRREVLEIAAFISVNSGKCCSNNLLPGEVRRSTILNVSSSYSALYGQNSKKGRKWLCSSFGQQGADGAKVRYLQ